MKRNQKDYFKRFFLIFSVICLFAVPLSAVIPSLSDIGIYDNVIRLHVLANSDSEIDQEVKLLVRDEILSKVNVILDGVTDRENAEKLLFENIPHLEATAKEALAENGFHYSASVTLTKEPYPKREYGGFSLPSGKYTSLRILLGEAEGQNWWCVLFPSLCRPLAQGTEFSEKELKEAGLTSSQIKIITGSSAEVKIKFRLIELISKWFS